MKRRLHQPPLSFVQFLFRGQQPFAEDDLRALQHPALVKRPMLRHEQLPNQIGMIEEKDLLRTDMELRRNAVLLRELLKERNRIALERSEVAERNAASWAARGGHAEGRSTSQRLRTRRQRIGADWRTRVE